MHFPPLLESLDAFDLDAAGPSYITTLPAFLRGDMFLFNSSGLAIPENNGQTLAKFQEKLQKDILNRLSSRRVS